MNYNLLFIFTIVAAVNAMITRILLKNLNYFLMDRGVYGIDVNKPGRIKIPEEGGLSITISLVISFGLLLVFFSKSWLILMIATTFLISLIGFIDHFRNIKPYPKFVYCMIVGSIYSVHFLQNNSLPLVPTILIILAIAIGYSVMVNAFNVLAGFNGLESGLAVISSTTLGIYYYFYNFHFEAGICFIVAVSFFVFWQLNKYPAKIFIGDSGSLVPASIYIGLAVVTRHWVPLLFVMAPHLINVFIKFLSTGVSSRSDHLPLQYKDGLLHLPSSKNYFSLIRLYLLTGPKKEQQIVNFVFMIEIICCISLFIFTIGSK